MNKQKSLDGEEIIVVSSLIVQNNKVVKSKFKIEDTITDYDPVFQLLEEMKKMLGIMTVLIDKLKFFCMMYCNKCLVILE